jgi:hypothetical protein
VPCVLQAQLKPIEDLLTGIERYFMLSTLVPPTAVAVIFSLHLFSASKKTDADYKPPPVVPLVLVWLFKIISPLAGASRLASAPTEPKRLLIDYVGLYSVHVCAGQGGQLRQV